MKFIVEGVVYEALTLETLTFAECRALEKQTGKTFQQVAVNPDLQGSMDVTQALVWLAMKRSNPDLTFYDLDEMVPGALETEDDKQEDEPEVPTAADEETSPADDSTT